MMASNNNVPVNLSLEEELECGEEIQNQLWLEQAARKKKAEVTALKAELRERTRANRKQVSQRNPQGEGADAAGQFCLV